MKIIAEHTNTLLHRKDVTLLKEFPTNPGIMAAKEFISQHYQVPLDSVVILAIRGGFGTHLFRIEARVYDSAEMMALIEPKPKVKKAGGSA